MNSSTDETGLSANYKPSVKLDPKLRKALLRVLTKLEQEDKQNEVSIRDINNQIAPTPNQAFDFEPTQQFAVPNVPSTSFPFTENFGHPQGGSSTHTPVSIYQDYSKLTQQPEPSPTAPTQPDFESYYRQFQNQQLSSEPPTPNPTETTREEPIQPSTNSTTSPVFSQADLETLYKQQATANNLQQQNNEQQPKPFIPEFVDFNQNFINSETVNEKLPEGYKIIKFDKNDKESINQFLSNNNIEIISTLNGNNPVAAANEALLSQLNINSPKDILLSNFIANGPEQKEISLAPFSKQSESKPDEFEHLAKESEKLNYGLPDPNEVTTTKAPPSTVLPTPVDQPSGSGNDDLFKSVILSSKVLPGSNAIFYNANQIQNEFKTELKTKEETVTRQTFVADISTTALPTSTENSDAQNQTSASSDNSNSTSEVQFFSVPLVAAFTLHQNTFGIPQKVIPLNYLENGEYISEDRVKSIEESIIINKQRQKIAATGNNTKELEELKAKETNLEKEKLYVDEKLKEFRQNESKEKLIQQQSIGFQTANLEQYLQKYRQPKFNTEFDKLLFGNNDLELKKSQLQEQFQREAELERYKKLEYEKIQELNRLEKLRQFEKNLKTFSTQTERPLLPSLTKQTFQVIQTPRPQDLILTQQFSQNFGSNFENLAPIDFQKSINVQYSQFPAQNSFSTLAPANQPNFIPETPKQPSFQANFIPQNQPNFLGNQQNFVPQPKQIQPIVDFNTDTFRPIAPRENFQLNRPNFQTSPASNFITGAQFGQPNFQQAHTNNFPIEQNLQNFRPNQPVNFQQPNFPLNDNFRFNRQFVQPNGLQSNGLQQFNNREPFFDNRIARKEPFGAIGNFGVNDFSIHTKSHSFKRNIVQPSRVLEPPVFKK